MLITTGAERQKAHQMKLKVFLEATASERENLIAGAANNLAIILEESTFLPGADDPRRVFAYGSADAFLGRLERYLTTEVRTEQQDMLWYIHIGDLTRQYEVLSTAYQENLKVLAQEQDLELQQA